MASQKEGHHLLLRVHYVRLITPRKRLDHGFGEKPPSSNFFIKGGRNPNVGKRIIYNKTFLFAKNAFECSFNNV